MNIKDKLLKLMKQDLDSAEPTFPWPDASLELKTTISKAGDVYLVMIAKAPNGDEWTIKVKEKGLTLHELAKAIRKLSYAITVPRKRTP